MLLGRALLPAQAEAQEAPGRFMLEAGIAGDSRACPGYYVGIDARVAGPVSLYGMVENFRCAERTEAIDLGGGITGTAIHPRRSQSTLRDLHCVVHGVDRIDAAGHDANHTRETDGLDRR